MAQIINEEVDPGYRGLCRVGGLAALLAGVLFRRNIAAEIALFLQHESPANAGDWFALLQDNRLLGLVHLNILDVVNYALLALMFLALLAVLRPANRSAVTIAAALGFLGIAVYLASNTALSMLSLSNQYAAATSEAQRAGLLGAGEAMLAINRFASAGAPGSAGYLSLLLVAAAGLITSLVMLRSHAFTRATAYVGIVAAALALAYCMAYLFLPGVEMLPVFSIPAAGLLLMVWHILIGWRLLRLAKEMPARSAPAQKRSKGKRAAGRVKS